jgi:flavin reductase (DIM6/NTAB) family NADH-FMN oxidoreductase RutF
MAGSSGACIRPSTVQSTTSVLPASAAITGAMPAIAPDAPVERVTGWRGLATLGSVTVKLAAPTRGRQLGQLHSTGRLWLSHRTATVSPGCSAQRRSTCSKASIQRGSMISCNMVPFRWGLAIAGKPASRIIHENSCKFQPCPLPAKPAARVLAQEFRAALGMFATGVTIVTARTAEGDLVGLTANSFNSVSLSPPLVLWSLARTAGSLPVFSAGSHYAINILAADQRALAERFATKACDRWQGVAFTDGAGGAPLIDGAAATFECFNRSRYEEGDHVIFVGEVERCSPRGRLAAAVSRRSLLHRAPAARTRESTHLAHWSASEVDTLKRMLQRLAAGV